MKLETKNGQVFRVYISCIYTYISFPRVKGRWDIWHNGVAKMQSKQMH